MNLSDIIAINICKQGSDNMRIAICDDEVSMVQILEEKIKKLLPDAVIDKYLSGDELIASGSKPDILFLDIQMPGMDGMETAKMLRQDNEDMILIFVTAAEEYVFQAFDVGAFHYLVKPFSDEKFKEVVTKAVHNIKRSSRLEKDEKYIMVQTAGSHIKIFLRDIVYAEVYNRKVIIHTRSTDIEYYGKLQELSDMAGTDFFRTHRAYLVHFKYVEKYDATNAIAQMLVANGHKLYFYTHYNENKHRNDMEIDFIISNNSRLKYKMFPIEVKSGKQYKTTSLNNFREKYKERIGESYIIHPRNLIVKDGIICIPPYMTMNI